MPPLHASTRLNLFSSSSSSSHLQSLGPIHKHIFHRPRISTRGVASSRRTVKALRTKPFPTAAAALKRNVPEQNTIVFNPPPTAPSPYHTPYLFLPADDPRRALLAPSHAHYNPYSSIRAQRGPAETQGVNGAEELREADGLSSPADGLQSQKLRELPPAIAPNKEKHYHLSPAQVEEIRALRTSNPWVWTRQRLAEKFGCSQFFVGMVANAIPERLEWAKAEEERIRSRWGQKRTKARDDRKRRRELWARDE